MKTKTSLFSFYNRLLSRFGPQGWWPADSDFEVMVGAILTQNTSWKNVALALGNLKKEKLMDPRKMYSLKTAKLARLIRPSGCFNIKAKRLKNFLNFFMENYRGSVTVMSKDKPEKLRKGLLSINGIGPETADSILLYALKKPVFVVDAYTRRIFSRHRLVRAGDDYDRVQGLFLKNLKKDARLFNEYHALLVKLGKECCLKNEPRCEKCPVN